MAFVGRLIITKRTFDTEIRNFGNIEDERNEQNAATYGSQLLRTLFCMYMYMYCTPYDVLLVVRWGAEWNNQRITKLGND